MDGGRRCRKAPSSSSWTCASLISSGYSRTRSQTPSCPSGVSKLCGEEYLFHFGLIHGMSTLALRYANVYGPGQDPHGEAGVVAIFLDRLLSNQPAVINGDGLQTRDYVYVDDIARA